MERSGFFNSVDGDRKYRAEQFAEYFNSFIGNGVFPNPSTNLQVTANNDMTVTLKAGKAWINGYIYINTDDMIIAIDPADGTLHRIDRLVVRYDVTEREIKAWVKKGALASTPAPPPLQRDADAYEIVLADIYIGKGVVSITQGNITDTRLNGALCGVVHGTIEQIDTTTLYSQYTQGFETKKDEFELEFTTWLQTLKDVLDGDTAGNLLNLIDAHKADTANPHNVTASQAGAAPASHVGLGGAAHSTATTSAAGFMSAADKSKLNGIAAGATNYTHPAAHSADMIEDSTTKKIMTAQERVQLAELVTSVDKYIHPDSQNPDNVTLGATGGLIKAQTNTSYTTAQLRNVILSPNAANVSAMQNGDIWIQYE